MLLEETVAADQAAVIARIGKKPIKVVTHFYPDTDALASIWAVIRLIATPQGRECTPVFVRAGNSLPAEDCEGYDVITIDTGLGQLDQHGKSLERASSFELFAKAYGLFNDPGLRPIIKLTVASDNVEKIDPCSIHYVLKGLPFYFKDKESREVDWGAVINEACKLFDIIYDQTLLRLQSEKDFWRLSKIHTLDNGLKVGFIFHHPRLREAGYEAGCDVMVWTQDQKGPKKGKYYVGIQCNRHSTATLESVVESLRNIEAGKRGTKPRGSLRAIGTNESCGAWYLHDSKKLIVCGSRSSELEAEQCTVLPLPDIQSVVLRKLAQLKK